MSLKFKNGLSSVFIIVVINHALWKHTSREWSHQISVLYTPIYYVKKTLIFVTQVI